MARTFQDFSDQEKIFNPAGFGWDIHLAGCGSLGSALFPLLLKLGVPRLHIRDRDILESRNIPAELPFGVRHVGMKKVEAAMDVAEYLGLAHGNTEIILHDEYVTAGTVLSGVVMTGVDSIAARRVIWEAVQNNLVDVPLLIDGRMAGEYAQVLTLCPTDFEFAEVYEDEWLTEGGTIPNLCGTRVTAYVCARVASDMVWSLTRFSRGLPMRFDSSVDFRFI